MRLHEHAAQLREVAPRSSRLSRSDGTLAKRSRGASPTASLSDEATDTGEAATVRKRRVIAESDDEEPVPMGSCAGLDDDEPPLQAPPSQQWLSSIAAQLSLELARVDDQLATVAARQLRRRAHLRELRRE